MSSSFLYYKEMKGPEFSFVVEQQVVASDWKEWQQMAPSSVPVPKEASGTGKDGYLAKLRKWGSPALGSLL